MEKDNLEGERLGIRFFATISASISHEIKNMLSVINENAGLLEDFSLMAENGRPIDPERLKSLSGKIGEYIRRADEIVKTMNRFSHSADEWEKSVDPMETASFMVRLCKRFAAMKSVTIVCDPASTPLTITTSPFHLEMILFTCIDYAIRYPGADKTISFKVEPTETGARIRFSGLGEFPSHEEEPFPNPEYLPVIEKLKGNLSINAREKNLVLDLPSRPE